MNLYIIENPCPITNEPGNPENVCKKCGQKNFVDKCFDWTSGLCIRCKKKRDEEIIRKNEELILTNQKLLKVLADKEEESKNFADRLEKLETELRHKKELPEPGESWTEPVTGMEFVYVPGGKFMMGDVFDDNHHDDEKPVHEVLLSSFYMGKYQVTQGQWEKVMKNNPSHFKKGDKYPVESISWNDTQEFIIKLTELNRWQYRFSLPTEAQWEYACRSGGKKERYSGGDDIDAAAWYEDNSGRSTHPVGQKKPNGLGIYDMSGNVWEWCQDLKVNYTADAVIDPVNSDKGSYRMRRGGSWGNLAQYCRSAYRNYNHPSNRGSDLGFRLVLSQVSR